MNQAACKNDKMTVSSKEAVILCFYRSTATFSLLRQFVDERLKGSVHARIRGVDGVFHQLRGDLDGVIEFIWDGRFGGVG